MKKKIAVMANGWDMEFLKKAMQGISAYAMQEDFDVYTFLSFASYSEHTSLMQGELNVYRLCHMEDYDGILVFSTLLNSVETAVALCEKAKESKVPVVSIGMEMEGVSSVCVSNEEGMRELVEHLVAEHGVKNKHGHLHGDHAIRLVADAIRVNQEGNWIAIRFGGDEFLIIAPDCEEEAAIRVRQKILDFLEKKNQDGSIPYQLTVSCGYVITDPEKGQTMSLQDYIREADRLMYEIKQELHAKEGKS